MYFKPKRIAITGGYHGCHASIDVYKRTRETELPLIGIDDEFQPGDLCWLETPLNPTGEARCVLQYIHTYECSSLNSRSDIKYYADKVRLPAAAMICM